MIIKFRYLKINANKTKTFLKCTKFDSHHNELSSVVCTLVWDILLIYCLDANNSIPLFLFSLAFVPKFADLFILVDSSASRQEQQTIRYFLSRLVKQLNVGKDFNRVGLAQFSENVKEEFLINTNKTKTEIVSSISSLTLRSTGDRRIGNAIEYAHKNFFTSATGSRVSEGFKQFLLVISAGESADGVVQASRTIKNDAVTVFAVGLNKADADEMKYISSQPHSYKLVGNMPQVQQKIKYSIDTWEDAAVARGECMHNLLFFS